MVAPTEAAAVCVLVVESAPLLVPVAVVVLGALPVEDPDPVPVAGTLVPAPVVVAVPVAAPVAGSVAAVGALPVEAPVPVPVVECAGAGAGLSRGRR